MKTNFDLETKSVTDCAGGDLILWNQGNVGLVGVAPDGGKRFVVELGGFSRLSTVDQYSELLDDFQCVATTKDWVLAFPKDISVEYGSSGRKIGDICVCGKQIWLAYVEGSRPTLYYINLHDGKALIGDNMPKCAAFSRWSISLETNDGSPLVLIEHK